MYKLVDLFCGCGGISRGFAWTNRFSTEMGVEIEPHPAATFHQNIKNSAGAPSYTYTGDITHLTQNKDMFWSYMQQANISGPGQIDVLVGGPPCQGFSRNGTRKYIDEERRLRFYDDPRNHLYRSFLYFLEKLQPSLVFIENVREFLNFGQGKFLRDLLTRLDELGYYAEFRKVCAADFGVPQMRHRALFVGIRKDLVSPIKKSTLFPELSHVDGENDLPLLALPLYRTVRDAIGDLPIPVDAHAKSPQPYGCQESCSELAKLLRSKSGHLHNHVSRVLSKTALERVKAVGTGRMKHIDPGLRTESFYGSAYGRLEWDKPSLTVTTWVYHVGSGRYAHPEQDRAITMREAARLQSFDDDFIFPPLINPVSQMIGNAVPPLLANAFAHRFIEILDGVAKENRSEPVFALS